MNDSKESVRRGSTERKAVGIWFLLLAAYPVVGIAVIHLADARFGTVARVAVGVIVFAGFFVFLRGLYRWGDRIGAQRRVEIRDAFRGIYRVKGAPSSSWRWLEKNIRVGDCGWERPGWRKDDLIYLHGLEPQWGVVWMAGFRRADVEYVTAKPISEYDWREFDYDGPKPRAPYNWGMSKAKTPCPFPVSAEISRSVKWKYAV